MGKIVTSINIDEDLLKQAKHYAIEENLTITSLIEKVLKKELKQEDKKNKE